MIIYINLAGRTYGYHHPQTSFNLSIDYDDYEWDASEEYIKRKVFLILLERVLLGKRTNADITNRGYPEVIVYKGERIAKLHIEAIVNCWYSVDFSKTSFESKIQQLKKDFTRRILKERIKKGEDINISIDFNYKTEFSSGSLQSGHLRISREVAEWLGKQLLLAD